MSYLDYHRLIAAAVISAVRIGAAFMVCPALSDGMVTGLARRLVVLAMAVPVFPLVLGNMPPGEPDMWILSFVAVKEAFLGFVIGFFSAMPFWIAENVGNFIDNQRGATMGEVYSPLSGTQVSTTGIFFTQLVSTAFFVSGAVLVMLGALYASYGIWPVFSGWIFPTPNAGAEILSSLDSMLRTTVVIAAPVVIIMFLATVGLGFVNRTAPQLNVFFLSMPVKSALGIAFLVIYLPFIMDMLVYAKEDEILAPAMKILSFRP